MISFQGAYFPKDIILHAVFFYVRYAFYYQNIEEIFQERRIKVYHTALYIPLLAIHLL